MSPTFNDGNPYVMGPYKPLGLMRLMKMKNNTRDPETKPATLHLKMNEQRDPGCLGFFKGMKSYPGI